MKESKNNLLILNYFFKKNLCIFSHIFSSRCIAAAIYDRNPSYHEPIYELLESGKWKVEIKIR